MDRRVSWIAEGYQVPELEGKHPFQSLDMPLRHFGLVEVEQRVDQTIIRWDPACADPDSVTYALDNLHKWRAPYKLLFYRQAWVEEVHFDKQGAIGRIEYIQASRSAPLLNDYFFWPLRDQRRPQVFEAAIRDHSDFSNRLLYCKVDDVSGYPIAQCGHDALTVQTMGGVDWLGTSLELDVWSERAMRASCSLYRQAHSTGSPQFDEVAAVISPPDGEPYWLRWYRALWPVSDAKEEDIIACFCIRVPTAQNLASRQFP